MVGVEFSTTAAGNLQLDIAMAVMHLVGDPATLSIGTLGLVVRRVTIAQSA